MRSARILAAIGLLVWLVLHTYRSLYTEINWDEFALLARASDSLREGRIIGDGRPGLATLFLMPLVDGCTDAITAVRVARLWWTPFVIGILAGMWLTLVRLFSDRAQAASHALIGVSLLALTPAFLRFGVQVRTDQPAIAMGLVAAAVLIQSRRRIRMAFVAGLLFGVGYLFSQKLLYVGALVGLLATADLILKGDLRLRRDIGRALAVAIGFLMTLVAYRGLVTLLWEPPMATSIDGQMSTFRFYREFVGYRHYKNMLPFMLGPMGLLAVQLILVPGALRRGGRDRRVGILWVAVLGLGLGVGLFHAGAFPYFWMTLGLFPAVALAIGWPLIMRLSKWTGRRITGPLWAVFLLTALYAGIGQSRDGQAVQRTTLDFANLNFPELEGFHSTRALFCRDNRDPLPTFFSQNIHYEFFGEGSGEAVEALTAQFINRPIGFLIFTFRLTQFPESVRRFWMDHYVPYSGLVYVPGTAINQNDPIRFEFEVIVPGEYSFYAPEGRSKIQIGSVELPAGGKINLRTGYYTIDRSQVIDTGLLAFSIPSPPGTIEGRFFRPF